MPQLSKLAVLGIARETTNNTYVAPTDYIPFNKAEYEDVFASIKDESYRGNDSGLQGLYQGVSEADWSIDVMAYPLIMGYFLRGIIGPDTITAGVSTTLSGAASQNATTITVASGTGIAAGKVLQIDSGANLEYVKVDNSYTTGTTVPLDTTVSPTGLQFAHLSGVSVNTQSTHVFKQSSAASNRATFSLTVYDTINTISYSGAAFSNLDIKIDPKNAVTLSSKMKSFQFASVAGGTGSNTPVSSANYDPSDPVLGWEWVMTNGGATSNRGTSLDWKITRKLDVIHASTGLQKPRDIFQGALDMEGTYKAIYENFSGSQNDLNMFLQWLQQPVTATLTQPVLKGGNVLTLTTNKGGVHKGKRDWGKTYVEADFSLSGIYNSTDGGLVQASLTNFKNTAY